MTINITIISIITIAEVTIVIIVIINMEIGDCNVFNCTTETIWLILCLNGDLSQRGVW